MNEGMLRKVFKDLITAAVGADSENEWVIGVVNVKTNTVDARCEREMQVSRLGQKVNEFFGFAYELSNNFKGDNCSLSSRDFFKSDYGKATQPMSHYIKQGIEEDTLSLIDIRFCLSASGAVTEMTNMGVKVEKTTFNEMKHLYICVVQWPKTDASKVAVVTHNLGDFILDKLVV